MARDFAFEELARVTSTDWKEGRGELNAALKSIKEQEPEIFDNYLLSCEITKRAKAYVAFMGKGIAPTPPPLAKHWKRVADQRPKPTYTPPSPYLTRCPTCDGHKLVLYATRPAKSREDAPFEEFAPCPDCNPIDYSH